jgi:hypothetical protein
VQSPKSETDIKRNSLWHDRILKAYKYLGDVVRQGLLDVSYKMIQKGKVFFLSAGRILPVK